MKRSPYKGELKRRIALTVGNTAKGKVLLGKNFLAWPPCEAPSCQSTHLGKSTKASLPGVLTNNNPRHMFHI